jgi:hypothetical protein
MAEVRKGGGIRWGRWGVLNTSSIHTPKLVFCTKAKSGRSWTVGTAEVREARLFNHKRKVSCQKGLLIACDISGVEGRTGAHLLVVVLLDRDGGKSLDRRQREKMGW